MVDAAERAGVDASDISIDFGLATSIAYYSGMIFEVSAVVDGEHVALGGGGRYDGLATALGSDEDVPGARLRAEFGHDIGIERWLRDV